MSASGKGGLQIKLHKMAHKLQQQLEILQAENRRLNERVSQTEEVQNLKLTNRRLKKQNEDLQRQVNEKDDAVRERDEEIEKVKQSHSGELQRLYEELDCKDRTIKDLKTARNKLQDEREKQLKGLHQEMRSREETIQELRKTNEELKTTVNCLRDGEREREFEELKALSRLLTKETTQREETQTKMKELSEVVSRLTQERDGLQENVVRLKRELTANQEELASTRRGLDQQTIERENLDRLQTRVDSLQTQRLLWKIASQKLLSDLGDLRNLHQQTFEDLQEKSSLNATLQRSLKGEMTRAEEAEKAHSMETRMLKEKHSQTLVDLQGELASKDDDIMQAKREKEAMLKEMESLLEEEKRKGALLQQNEEDLNSKIMEVEEELHMKEVTISNLEQSLSKEKSEKGRALEACRHHDDRLRELLQEKSSIQSKIVELEEELHMKEVTISSLEQSLSEEEKEKASAQRSLSIIREQLDEEGKNSESKTRTLRNALNKADSAKRHLTEEVEKYKRAMAENARLNERIEELEQELRGQQNVAMTLSEEKAEWDEERDQMEENFKRAEQRAKRFENELERIKRRLAQPRCLE